MNVMRSYSHTNFMWQHSSLNSYKYKQSNAHPIQIKEETYYARVCHHFYYTDFSIQIQTGQRDDIQIHLVGFSTYIWFTTHTKGPFSMKICKSAGLAQGQFMQIDLDLPENILMTHTDSRSRISVPHTTV